MRALFSAFSMVPIALTLPALLSLVACDSKAVAVDFDPAAPTAGSGACLALPAPRVCYRTDEGQASCTVGPEGQSDPMGGPLAEYPNGCVGSFMVLAPGTPAPDLQNPSLVAVFVGPVKGPDGQRICCAEDMPGTQVPHIVSYDAGSRALFVRTAEPVSGASQVAIRLDYEALYGDGSHVRNRYLWRFYVGAAPAAR